MLRNPNHQKISLTNLCNKKCKITPNWRDNIRGHHLNRSLFKNKKLSMTTQNPRYPLKLNSRWIPRIVRNPMRSSIRISKTMIPILPQGDSSNDLKYQKIFKMTNLTRNKNKLILMPILVLLRLISLLKYKMKRIVSSILLVFLNLKEVIDRIYYWVIFSSSNNSNVE